MANVETPDKVPVVGHSTQGLDECGDISMVTNVGSTIGEDTNLSDCEVNNQPTYEDELVPESSDHCVSTHGNSEQDKTTREDKLVPEGSNLLKSAADHGNGEQDKTTPTSPQSPIATHRPTLATSEEQNEEIDCANSAQIEEIGATLDCTTPKPSDCGVNTEVQNGNCGPNQNTETSENIADNSGGPSNLSTSDQPNVPIEEGSVEDIAPSCSATSIYLEDGDSEEIKKKMEHKPKRMTMAQRATVEALASFGGIGLASVPVRKRDLHYELKKEAEQDNKKRQLEAEEAKMEEPPSKRPRTRLQVAKQEAEEMFHDVPLANGRKKNSRVYNLKANSIKSSQRSIVRNRQTRADRAKREALESFGGASMDTVQVKNNSACRNSSKVDVNESTAQPAKRLTRVEQARLEALQSFGGGGLQDVMTGAKRRIARTLEKPKQDGQNDCSGETETVEKENVDVDPVPVVTNTE